MAAGTLSAHAEFSGLSRELYTRAAWHEGILYYELRPGKVVRVDQGGWTFGANPPVLFRRYVNLKALPEPEAGGGVGGVGKKRKTKKVGGRYPVPSRNERGGQQEATLHR